MLAKMETNQQKMDATHERTMAKMDAQLEKMEACVEIKEPTSLEVGSEAVHDGVPKKDAAVKLVEAHRKRHTAGI
jgi:hypothetical protein